MLESLGPHFFSRTFKEEGGGSGSDASDAALFKTYHIELSATGLGMTDIVFAVLRVCADVGGTGLLDSYTVDEKQRKKVGSATVSMTVMRFQHSEDVDRSCKIEQLEVETGNILTNVAALVAMLRYIQSFCVRHHAKHLAMVPMQGSCWVSDLLKPTGFNRCDCEHLDKHDGVENQLCMALPTSPTDSPVRIDTDKPVKEPAKKAWRRPDDKPGVVAESSTLGKPSLPQHQEIGISPAASQEVTEPEHSKASEAEGLTYGNTNKVTASSKTPQSTRPAAMVTGTPGSLPKKVYCMFWIRKGECDYTQTGCKYKHEMPDDEETLSILGLREIPSWFREHPEYNQSLRQVNRSATRKLTGVGHGDKDKFTGPWSHPGSDRSDSPVGTHGGAGPATTRHETLKLGNYTVQPSHQHYQQSIVASNTEAKTAPASPPSATKVISNKAANISADRRSERDMYKPPRARASSGAGELRAAARERSKPEGAPASSTHSGRFKRNLSPSAEVAPSVLPGNKKGRSSSPAADVNDLMTGLELKRATVNRAGGKIRARGRYNGQTYS